jgi:hypothetical protein
MFLALDGRILSLLGNAVPVVAHATEQRHLFGAGTQAGAGFA